MIERFNPARSSGCAVKFRRNFPPRLFCLLASMALLVALGPARAGENVGPSARTEEPDDLYLKVYHLIERGDALSQSGQREAAEVKYEQARAGLLSLKQSHPAWDSKLVAYRLDYLTEKLAALSRPAGEPATVQAGGPTPAASPARLLEAGAEPRTALRFHPQPGDRQIVDMTVKMALGLDTNGKPGEPIKMPAMRMTWEIAVKDVSAAGDITYEMKLADAGLADETGAASPMAEAIKTTLGGLKGISSTGTLSPHGATKSRQVNLPASADPQTRQVLEQVKESLATLLLPLPEEPVGVGAKWEVKQPLKTQGLTLQQTTTCQLATMEGERLSLATRLDQNAANQKIQSPAMPNLKLDVTRLTGSGTGDLTLDLTQLFPVKARMNSQSEVVMSVNTGGQKQTMTMRTEAEFSAESK
jgi:hypothetical protein